MKKDESFVRKIKKGLKKLIGQKAAKNLWRVKEEIHFTIYACLHFRQRFLRCRKQQHCRKQKSLSWDLKSSNVDNYKTLKAWLSENHIYFQEGGHTIYVPPQHALASIFGRIVDFYPDDAGYKIIKSPGTIETTEYLQEGKSTRTRVQSMLMESIVGMVSSSNYLYLKGISPKIYDVIELNTGKTTFPAYVVQHIEGEPPTESEHSIFILKLEKLIKTGELNLVHPNWKNNPDFQGPDCNSNLIKSSQDDRLYYVDFQNFILPNPEKLIKRICQDAKNDSHFGSKHLIRGGKYLYQSVPEINFYGKRSISSRWRKIKDLLVQANVKLHDMLILDIGCNIGMIMAQSLQEGALWALGWDQPNVIKHAEEILRLLGYSRFDLKGVNLSKNYPLKRDIPGRFVSMLDNTIIFYLAVREHIGFISALADIPWQAMVYEGHQGEDLSNLSDLSKMCKFSIAASIEYRDADSNTRPLAVLVRE